MIFPLLRIIIGTVFLVSGFEKVIGPYQNFMYVIEGYDVFSPLMQEYIAKILPWMELIIGLFLVLGLWIQVSLKITALMIAGFIIIVSQALVRGLHLGECGCFGELISLPLHVVALLDSTLLALTFLCSYRINKTTLFSLDFYFNSEK